MIKNKVTLTEFIKEHLKSNSKFLFDTSFLLDKNKSFEEFLKNNYIEITKKTNKADKVFLILPAVINELKKHRDSSKDEDLQARAKEVLAAVAQMVNKEEMHISDSSTMDFDKELSIEESKNTFADNKLLSAVHGLRNDSDIILFTNDHDLNIDVLKINDTKSCAYSNIICTAKYESRLDDIIIYPNLSAFFDSKSSKRPDLKHKVPISMKNKNSLNDEVVALNDTVKSKRSKYTLTKCTGKGGEGNVYEVAEDKGIVVKIYKKEKRTQFRLNKITLMIERKLELNGVTFPIDIIYSNTGNFIGFSMQKIHGISIFKILGTRKIEKQLPEWNRLNLTNLALRIAEKISEIHSLGIVIGDINATNIFLDKNSGEVYILDADSFQIDNYPCEVGQETFRAPEINSNQKFDSFLRNYQHDDFAASVLIFIILNLGKGPYSVADGKSERNKFCFTQDKANIPLGYQRYIWSFFPKNLKGIFEDNFAKQDLASRASIFDLKNAIDKYSKAIKFGKDKNDKLIIPLSYKAYNGKYVKCKCKMCQEVFEKPEINANKTTKLCAKCLLKTHIIHKTSKRHIQKDTPNKKEDKNNLRKPPSELENDYRITKEYNAERSSIEKILDDVWDSLKTLFNKIKNLF